MSLKHLGVVTTVVALITFGVVNPAHATPPTPGGTTADGQAPEHPPKAQVPPADRDKLLRPNWRSSADRAWTTTGDSSGLHVLTADERDGYAWRTAATLSEPGFDTDQWIGHACLTQSGKRAVAVYAPRTFSNDPTLALRGGFAAVVNLEDGKVTKLPITTSLAYFNPGCGAGENAVLTQEGDESIAGTRLVRVNAATGKLSAPITTAVQVSSAVPTSDGIVAAAAKHLVRVSGKGALTALANTSGVPFDLTVDRSGGVVHSDRAGDTVRVRRTSGKHTDVIGKGALSAVRTQRGTNGKVFVTGPVTELGKGATSVVRLAEVTSDEQVSTTGALAVKQVVAADATRTKAGVAVARAGTGAADADAAKPVTLAARVVANKAPLSFVVQPDDVVSVSEAQGRASSPALRNPSAKSRKSLAGSNGSNPVDEDRWCSVPRNDRNKMTYQPTTRQVEWAVDQAVRGSLNVARPANWNQNGDPAYSTSQLFPRTALSGGGFVPAQILFGVLTQESNLWQADRYTSPGEYGNPLTGNVYGRTLAKKTGEDEHWDIDWTKSDCGYGMAQVTDGMRLPEHLKDGVPALPPNKQRAVAMDFAANIAAGHNILADKWNFMIGKNMKVNGGDPQFIENWYLALWAYNSGYYERGNPKTDGTVEGLGWFNNPANPHYPVARGPFLEISYADAAHPELWPYQEKVIGWAGHPMATDDGYSPRAAWWGDVDLRKRAQPPPFTFCTSDNECDQNKTFPANDDKVTGEPDGPCGHQSPAGTYNLQCYWHSSTMWKPCPTGCGHEFLRFDPGWAQQPDGTNYPPICWPSGPVAVPTTATLVDDVPDSSIVDRCANQTRSTEGTFTFDFAADSTGNYASKIDFHQLSGGLRGHFWFTHTVEDKGGQTQRVTGTWRPPAALTGWTRVKVYVPNHSSWDEQADYKIDLGGGTGTRHRVVNQASHVRTADGKSWMQDQGSWRDIGVFNLAGNASVSLSNMTRNGRGQAIAWDAIAFIPTTKPLVDYVAMGDSYSSGEGLHNNDGAYPKYDPESDYFRSGDKGTTTDECHRSSAAYSRLVRLPNTGTPIAALAAAGAGSTAYAHIACASAVATAFTDEAVDTGGENAGMNTPWDHKWTHSGEVPQTAQGYLSPDTTLVTLTLGGNDVRYNKVMQGCVGPTTTCFAHDWKLSIDDVLDPDPLYIHERVVFELAAKKLEIAYRAIQEQAPNARIIVLGYGNFFPDQIDDQTPCTAYFNPPTARFINELSSSFSSMLTQTVNKMRLSGMRIEFADAYDTWHGHEACGGTNIYTNGVIAPDHSGSGEKRPLGGGSFHPTEAGQQAYAGMVEARLR